jgi:hypothetical protein
MRGRRADPPAGGAVANKKKKWKHETPWFVRQMPRCIALSSQVIHAPQRCPGGEEKPSPKGGQHGAEARRDPAGLQATQKRRAWPRSDSSSVRMCRHSKRRGMGGHACARTRARPQARRHESPLPYKREERKGLRERRDQKIWLAFLFL